MHGRGGDHKGQWRLKEFTQFRKRAAERGYFVLCPHLGTDHVRLADVLTQPEFSADDVENIMFRNWLQVFSTGTPNKQEANN